tara:strand:+ start:1149 stop:2003 length:855 start_codon:yes stop_codon:yes gene_type:complete
MASPATIHQLHKGQQAMPSKNGFITVWRDIQKQPWYKSPEHLAIFMHILTSATHQHRSVDFKGVPVSLLPGQFITTYKKLAETFGIESESKVRRIVNKFIKLDQITKANLKKGRTDIGLILTINNWEKWQKADTPSDTPSDTPKVAYLKGLNGSADTQTDTPSDTLNNNDINNKLVSKDTCQNSEEFSPAQLPKVPHQEIINLFGEILPSLPQPKKLTAARQKSIRARHMNDLKADVNNWRKYFTYIRDNCQWMLSGQYNVDFDYVIRQSTFVKILEGAKDDRK